MQGEDQKKLDILANEVFINVLRKSGQCAVLVSASPHLTAMGRARQKLPRPGVLPAASDDIASSKKCLIPADDVQLGRACWAFCIPEHQAAWMRAIAAWLCCVSFTCSGTLPTDHVPGH